MAKHYRPRKGGLYRKDVALNNPVISDEAFERRHCRPLTQDKPLLVSDREQRGVGWFPT